MARLPGSVEIFERNARRYDSWYDRNRVTAENEIRLVLRASSGAQEPCLEVGGGTGYFASRLGCTNLDPSLEMLKISRRRGLEAVQGFGESIPAREGGFRTVLVVVTICFVDSPPRLLEEIRRVLARRGTLILCTIPADSAWGKHYQARRDSPFYAVARFLTRSEVLELLSSKGFVVKEILGTLSYSPLEEPRLEEPSPDKGDHGFVCYRASKE